MTSEEMLKQIAALPVDARREVEDFVARLAKHLRESQKSSAASDLASEPFIGMWRDRDDMSDSSAWVRSIRKKHWRN
jgi:DNA-directed RNA polymerase specialized sigma24 family protein